MRFRKGGRYRRSEVDGLPTTPIILCVVVSVSRLYITVSVSRSYVTRLFKVDTDLKRIHAKKKKLTKFLGRVKLEYSVRNFFKFQIFLFKINYFYLIIYIFKIRDGNF